jgi:hypothetical protein
VLHRIKCYCPYCEAEVEWQYATDGMMSMQGVDDNICMADKGDYMPHFCDPMLEAAEAAARARTAGKRKSGKHKSGKHKSGKHKSGKHKSAKGKSKKQ